LITFLTALIITKNKKNKKPRAKYQRFYNSFKKYRFYKPEKITSASMTNGDE